MAENEDGAEKSEDPTEKRRREAREQGQLARSRELSMVTVTLGGIIALLVMGEDLGHTLMGIMQSSFDLNRETLLSEDAMSRLLKQDGLLMLKALLPLLLVLSGAAVLGAVALGGWMFSTETLMPQFGRMNPLSGIQRMFSGHALIELLKAFAKFLVVLTVALLVLSRYQQELISISKQSLQTAILHSMEIVGWSALWMALGLLLIAAVDVPYQWWENRQKLMMTKQEVRDEFKDSEGKPEVKARIRRLQREMTERRMMQAIPTADVVITNPTHFAVALKYDMARAQAPILIAKGGDFLALKIREIAVSQNVMVLESPALARAIYFSTDLDREIPSGLYLAVAQVLAYVYQLRRFQSGQGRKPDPLKEIPIPEEFRKD